MKKKAEIRVPRPLPSITFDRTLIREMFHNLITNALKYTNKDIPWVEIGFKTSSGKTKNPVLYIKDNGIGIEKKFYDKVFEMFKCLHGVNKFEVGTGAGLSIVKKIIESHNGTIWVESVPETGTTFYFTLGEPSHRRIQ